MKVVGRRRLSCRSLLVSGVVQVAASVSSCSRPFAEPSWVPSSAGSRAVHVAADVSSRLRAYACSSWVSASVGWRRSARLQLLCTFTRVKTAAVRVFLLSPSSLGALAVRIATGRDPLLFGLLRSSWGSSSFSGPRRSAGCSRLPVPRSSWRGPPDLAVRVAASVSSCSRPFA